MMDRARAHELPTGLDASPAGLASARQIAIGAALYYLLALVCVYLSRQPRSIATMWLPDAFASIYLLLMPARQRPWMLGALALVLPGANLSYGDPWRIAVSFVPANLSQVGLGAWLLARHAHPRLAVADPWQLVRALALGGLLPAMVGATVATLSVPTLAGTPLGPSVGQLWLSWVVSTFFGAATLLPLGLWILAGGSHTLPWRRPGTAISLVLVTIATWASLRWLPSPFAYVITMLVFVALFGGFVTSALAALLASVVLNASFALGGYRAPHPDHGSVIFVVLPMLIAIVPTVLIGAIREKLDQQYQRVKSGEALQRSMLDASPNLLCLVDEQGRVARMNAAGARMLGAPHGEALRGRNFADLIEISPDATPGRAIVHTLDGRRLMAEWHREALPLHSDLGAMVYALRDITAELEAQRMREQATRSEADSRAKSEFLSRMSHELRTPLNAVLGYAQLMEATLNDAHPTQQRDRLQHISQAGWHLLAMIDDVLELARLESGSGAPRIQPVRLSDVVDQACAMVRHDAARRHITVDAAPMATAWVLADPLRLRQTLINLIGNAVKYNRDGGHVGITCASEGRDHWTLSVSDTGLGIPTELQDQVFEPFNRLGHAHSTVPGTGIGLSITRKLVEAMQGQIGFRSEPDRGSVFWVTLPATQAPGNHASAGVTLGNPQDGS